MEKFLMTTSWDDGHPLDFRVAGMLARFGLTGTFYVPRTGQREVMNTSQILELSSTFEIGSHTLEHLVIDRLSDSAATAQLSGSREWIEQLTGKSCQVFCFPGGKFRSRQLRLVRQAGYKGARTVELLSTASPKCIDGLCLMPTTVQVFPHTPYAYARNTLKRFSTSFVSTVPRSLPSRDWFVLAKYLLMQTVKRGGGFHLWGHSWEIEAESQWRQLEEIFSLMKSCKERLRSVTNGELGAYAS
jgi:peptidoglycan/xylan/chitin deacetylase (PgdA/CDA1 family)